MKVNGTNGELSQPSSRASDLILSSRVDYIRCYNSIGDLNNKSTMHDGYRINRVDRGYHHNSRPNFIDVNVIAQS